MISARFPFLSRKLATIYNVVDLQLFRPSAGDQNGLARSTDVPFRIVVAASYQENKNMMGVAEALLLLKQDHCNPAVVIDWFGAVQSDRTPFQQVERFISEKGLGKTLRLHPATREIAGEYSRADAVGLFSFFEGLPNVICEGMACGKPIILSEACDAGNLVRHGRNGFLCDPTTPVSICKAIQQMSSLDPEKRRQMGLESRKMAEIMFDESLVLERYEQVLQFAWRREAVAIGCNWAGEAPCSAVATVNRWKRIISQSE